MMGGSPSWWNMNNDLRSSSTSDHHQQHNPNLLLSQTSPCTSSENHLLLSSSLHINLPHNNSSTSSSPSSSSSSSSATTCSSSSLLPFSSLVSHHHDHRPQVFPHSWSQLLLGGLASEQEERFGPSLYQSTRVIGSSGDDVKQEVTSPNTNNNNNLFGYHNNVVEQDVDVNNNMPSPWSLAIPISPSPKSCVTSLSSNTNTNNNNNNNMLDFSTSKISLHQAHCHQNIDHSNSESNSSANGGATNKKPKVQSSSNPPLKVRKEKLGDRITALHQLVSPFGKTDTASVLLEAIGYIRFLQGQIEALSSPYIGNNNAPNQQSVHGDRNCLFPDHPGQLLNDSGLKRRGASTQEELKDATRDLKSRGLCLVPISCTHLVGSDNGADYWTPSLGGGF